MKTFSDLKVGDYFYELNGGILYRNKITDIDVLGEDKVFTWIDNNDHKGITSIPFTKTSTSVYGSIFLIVCVTVKDIINVLCDS